MSGDIDQHGPHTEASIEGPVISTATHTALEPGKQTRTNAAPPSTTNERAAIGAGPAPREAAPPPVGAPGNASAPPAHHAAAVHSRADLGNYDSATGKHVLVLRTWDNATLAARRVELQGRLSTAVEVKARDELLREYEAIEWVARERKLALPKDREEEAAPQAFSGGQPIKFQVPATAQGMRAMLEREMAAGSGYDAAREHAQQRIGFGTLPRSPANDDKREIGEQQTALMDHDAAAFRASFRIEAKQVALAMLDASTIAVDAALRPYGIVGGAFRLTDAARNVARDPGKLFAEVDKWAALSAHADDNHAAFKGGHDHRDDLAQKAQQLRDLQDNIAVLAAEQLRLSQLAHGCLPEGRGTARPNQLDPSKLTSMSRASPAAQSTTQSPFERRPKPSVGAPVDQLVFVHGALRARQAQFKATWIQAEREHPVLAAFRGRKEPDASTLSGIGSSYATTHAVLQQILPKLGNIYRTKAALEGSWGTLDPLQLAPAVELTKQRMFVASGSYRDRAVHDLVEQAHADHGGLVQWALEAVMIGLTLVSLIPTAGASATAGLALTGLAYDIYVGLGEYEDFELTKAAGDTDLDQIRSLSDAEPSLTPLLTRMVSAGIELTVAARLFRRAVALRRTAMASNVDREALAALNQSGEMEGIKGLGDEAVARLEISGTAASPRVKFRPNPKGEVRSLAQALEIAERNGVDIDPERFRFVIGALPDNIGGKYFDLKKVQAGQMIQMASLTDRQGRFVVQLNSNILDSDDKILGVIAHEIYEIEALAQAFLESGGRLEATRVFSLINAEQGTAHSAAWDYADSLIEQLQAQKRYP